MVSIEQANKDLGRPALTLGPPLTNNMGVALMQPAVVATEKMGDSMANLAREMGVNAEGLEAFFNAINAAAAAYTATPRDELRFRLNANLVGEDPGQPVNTGPDGWRI